MASEESVELAEHGVPFWAMQSEDTLKIFRLSVALNKKVHERVAKMKQVSRATSPVNISDKGLYLKA